MKGKEVALVFQVYTYVCMYVGVCVSLWSERGAVKRVSKTQLWTSTSKKKRKKGSQINDAIWSFLW